MNIVGAGMAGLLCGQMLRNRNPVIYEAQQQLPNNHSAVLRFKTSSVGDVLNIPFRKVSMIKAHLPWKNPIADVLAYSFKNTGKYRSDRSIAAGLVSADRWVAPHDLIRRMSEGLCIKFNEPFDFTKTNSSIISTIPMGDLMDLLEYPLRPDFQFNYAAGLNIKATIANCDAYISLLVPDPSMPFSRISITGNEMIIEGPANKLDPKLNAELCISVAIKMLGIDETYISDMRCYPQRYAKITPIDDDARKAFMHWATDKHNVYSLGRFATWRPQLLMDDLVNDVRRIDHWITAGRYAVARDR